MRHILMAVSFSGVLGCTASAVPCAGCGTGVVAAVGEPGSLLPPLVYETVGRDIGDLIFERLADLKAGGSPVDTGAFIPRLASSWERVDSVTWRFRLRSGARWQDGTSLTAEDVRFSFEAFSDPVLDSPARLSLENRLAVQVQDDSTFLVRFPNLPRSSFTMPRITSASYRLTSGQPLGGMRVCRYEHSAPHRVRPLPAGNPEAALNLVLSGEADLLETVGSPANASRFAGDTLFELRPYPAAMYGFLAFRLAGHDGKPHPLFGSRELRRGLSSAIDRTQLAKALFGEGSEAPNGPMSRLLWVNSPRVAVLPYDPAAASRVLDSAGWRRTGAWRTREGQTLAFDILVPSSSGIRKQAALILQESWRKLGAKVSVTAVDFPVFQERIGKGQFDSYIGAYLDQPSGRSLADAWTRKGWTGLNYGRYENTAFDTLLARAGRTAEPEAARAIYREALDTLNADAPALFLFAPNSLAAIRRTLAGARINPYSWISGIPDWRMSRSAQVITVKAEPQNP